MTKNRFSPEEAEFEAVLARVERRERAERRVRVLGAVWAASSGLFFLLAGFLFLAIAPWGFIAGDPVAAATTGTIGSVVAGILVALGLPGFVAGLGLMGRRRWARPLAVVLAVLALFQVPLGTVLGAITLAILLSQEGTDVFEIRASQTVRA